MIDNNFMADTRYDIGKEALELLLNTAQNGVVCDYPAPDGAIDICLLREMEALMLIGQHDAQFHITVVGAAIVKRELAVREAAVRHGVEKERGVIIREINTLFEDMPKYEIQQPIDYEGGTCGGLGYYIVRPYTAPSEDVMKLALVDPTDLDDARQIYVCQQLLFRALTSLVAAPHIPCTGDLPAFDEILAGDR